MNQVPLTARIFSAIIACLYAAGFCWTITGMTENKYYFEALVAQGAAIIAFGGLAAWGKPNVAWKLKLIFASIFISIGTLSTIVLADNPWLEIVVIGIAIGCILYTLVSPAKHFQRKG